MENFLPNYSHISIGIQHTLFHYTNLMPYFNVRKRHPSMCIPRCIDPHHKTVPKTGQESFYKKLFLIPEILH